jgi:ornithine cyclodeaminase
MAAIAGVAMRVLALPQASVAAVIGTGKQARWHALAAAAVRPLREMRIYGRGEEGRNGLAGEIAAACGIACRPVSSAEQAAEGADIVILATNSYRPVIEAAWLSPGAFVHTVGFKSPAAKEMGLDVAERAGLLVTDSLAQVATSGRGFVLSGTPHLQRLIDLAELVSGKVPGRADAGQIVASYAMGLAGAEIAVAGTMLERPGA